MKSLFKLLKYINKSKMTAHRMFLHSKTGRWSATEQGLVNLTRQFNVKLILLDTDQNKVRSYTYPETTHPLRMS